MRRIVLLFLTVLCLTLFPAGTAAAHTALTSSTPAAGAVLTERPAQVALTFDDPVTGGEDAIRVYDDRMRRVDLGGHPGGEPQRTVRVALPGSLRAGTFSVAWQVASADGHFPSGTFRFSLGAAGPVAGSVPPAEDADDGWSGALRIAARGLGYAGLALGPGVLLVVLWLWPGGLGQRRVRVLVLGGLALLGVATVTSSAVGAVAGHAHDSGGSSPAVRFYAVLAVVGLGWWLVSGGRTGRWPAPVATLAVLALLATWPPASHAVTGRQQPLAFVADLAHVGAMAVWLGGLALLVVAPGSVRGRFSRVAFGCVGVLAVTGVYQAWRVGVSVSGVGDSSYGRVLLLKLAGVAVILALAAVVRRRLQRPLLIAELLTGAAVLALTTVLVTTALPG